MDKESLATIYSQVSVLAQQGGLGAQDEAMLQRGARLFHFPDEALHSEDFTHQEKEAVSSETAHRWAQPAMLYFLVAIGALAAVAQVCGEEWLAGSFVFMISREWTKLW